MSCLSFSLRDFIMLSFFSSDCSSSVQERHLKRMRRRSSVRVGFAVPSVFVSTFLSNTAAVNLLIPIGAPFAARALATGGSGSIQMGLSIALAASLYGPFW